MKTNRKIRFYFASLAIFLIPFDSFPLFIGGSIYRPVSVFPLLCYFVLMCFDKLRKLSVNKQRIKLFFLFLILLFISTCKAIFYNDYEGIIDFFLTGTLGFVTFVSFADYFELLKTKRNVFEYVGKLYIYAMIIPCFFGLLQLVTILTDNLPNFFLKLYSLATIRYDVSRVFLVCGEPSWAVIYLIILLYFLAYLKTIKYRKLYLCVSILLILLTFSMLGYLSIFIALLIYFCFSVVKQPSKIIYLFVISFFGIIFLFVFDKFVSTYMNNSYIANRYLEMKKLVTYITEPEYIYKYIQVADNSIFMRFVNPLIGIIMSLQHPFLGVGGGFYYKLYPNIIKTYFPLSVNLLEVNMAINLGYHTTSKNLFCRFFAEFGLFVGVSIFLKFIANLKYIKKNDKKNIWLLVLIFTVVFNFDSLCYIPFIFLLCLFRTIIKK